MRFENDGAWFCRYCGMSFGEHQETHCIFIKKPQGPHDEVNNPKHYDLFPGQQSIDVIRAALTDEEWRGFLKGNIIKYRLRAGEKGPAEKCLAKANWYRDKLWGEHENLD